MNGRRLAIMIAAGLLLTGCANHAVTVQDWVNEPDLVAIDQAIDAPAAQRLAGSFLRSQDPAADGATVRLQRVGAPVVVYATNPRADRAGDLEQAGIESYIAVPVRVSGRDAADTMQLEPRPPYRPRAMATGVEETNLPRPAGARLLLDYPTHTWFAWTPEKATVLSSGALPDLAGKEFDAAGLRADFGRRVP
ncbi:hypothetical protein NBRGN_098_00440 [Nocardia brasiliensis NBRC 14402]|uniref:hypothetical protein n=1 Tax=Nocardia brasiliensis TaxID=37326 RepID=UPI000310670C|nr:hypothetical protein [Nocardia brasiliensis]ASF08368.1 hypothetical protein CEQ30_14510 [Nocardia brasiliensis]GAJ85611.1 hypothetical protein NBRGN_098_00440 [Nocardia brasiliensis NBRC 14402]SUB41164.1 Uncharacterised protein [Nocardia brasiliensis]